MKIGVGFSCRFSYYVVSYLHVYIISFSGFITSAGEEGAQFSDIVYL